MVHAAVSRARLKTVSRATDPEGTYPADSTLVSNFC
ncbi:unnamed protein product [Penicillium roqueforti FM164]|uniref:Genomic scaffold, ProqFM164S02 n=1 Tax=Penicillium roqueforti (strain FM164) TaxID=1365484 RepID=W6Q2A1_PENRF|nr:unnamed protein product [Penicillium roqueforti FM164]